MESGAEVPTIKLEMCSACQESLLNPPIFQCADGHLFCHCCESKLENCPEKSCRKSIEVKIRNSYLENQLKRRTFQCQHCTLTLALANFKDHQLDCIQRKQNFCSKLGLSCEDRDQSLFELIPHLKSKHNLTGVELPDHHETLIEVRQAVKVSSLDSNSARWMPHYFRIGDNNNKLFLLRTWLDSEIKCVSWTVFLAGSQWEADKIFGRLQLISRETSSSTLEAIEWRGQIMSLLHSGRSDNNQLQLHISTLKQLRSKNHYSDLESSSEIIEELKVSWKLMIQITSFDEDLILDRDNREDIDAPRDDQPRFVLDNEICEGSTMMTDPVDPPNYNDFITFIRSIR